METLLKQWFPKDIAEYITNIINKMNLNDWKKRISIVNKNYLDVTMYDDERQFIFVNRWAFNYRSPSLVYINSTSVMRRGISVANLPTNYVLDTFTNGIRYIYKNRSTQK